MIDFTSSLYLGLRHASESLQPWAQLTTGAPAALRPDPKEKEVAGALAAVIGCDAAALVRSSLHAFFDLLGALPRRAVVYVDDDVYASAQWGVERARSKGVFVASYRHLNARSLLEKMHRASPGARPVVVTDGFCPSCGRIAPLDVYQRAATELGGAVVIDDTQALGVLGERPSAGQPYGIGGGGVKRRLGLGRDGLVIVASLAKGFGAPLCVVGGGRAVIDRFIQRSETRVHSSPPSAADLSAAAAALEVNRIHGDDLRSRLATRVLAFRRELTPARSMTPGLFPVQTVKPLRLDPARLHDALRREGVHAALHAPHRGRGPRVSFLITAGHDLGEVRRVGALVARLDRRGVADAPTTAFVRA